MSKYRKISLIRDEKVVRSIDLYEYLLKGKLPENIQLRDQDCMAAVIHLKKYKEGGDPVPIASSRRVEVNEVNLIN